MRSRRVRGRRVLVLLVLACAFVATGLGIAQLTRPARSVDAAGVYLGTPHQHSLLFLGASYTAGLGATSPHRGYAEQLAATLGWPAEIAAVPGAGYLNAGPHGHDTFAEQLTRLPANLNPGLVVIQGGRNDGGFTATRLRAAACATVRQARRKYAEAEVVMLGNVPFSQRVSAGQKRVESALTAASRSCRVAFVDPIAERWITRQNAARLVGRVPGHPNDAGYSYIAQRLLADLERLSHHRILPAGQGKLA
ncbi:MAG TPA: SGNH/GDSL hydrolase family protein [Jatrophihabitans sp.]|nr:SGNH/GDSL hydrolase family protein [Jatrophihabitans sp.]